MKRLGWLTIPLSFLMCSCSANDGGATGFVPRAGSSPMTAVGSGFNNPGNILITDQFNNRVIEIDPGGNTVWQFGNGPGDTSANAIVGTNDAERVGDLTLMSGTGIPPASPRTARRAASTTG